MRPRDGRNRRRRPIDQVLNPDLPTSPATGGITTPGRITGPVDEVLSDTGGNGGGEANPWVNPFMEVYETTEAGALRRLDKRQQEMSKKFAHKGGYFGGKHAIAQGEMEAETGAYLDRLLAETSLGASERQYQDEMRARNEILSLVNLIPTLLGIETTQPVVQMPQQGKGAGVGNILGAGAGSILGPMGATVGSGLGDKVMKN